MASAGMAVPSCREGPREAGRQTRRPEEVLRGGPLAVEDPLAGPLVDPLGGPLDLPSVEDPLGAVGLPEEDPEEVPSVVAGTWPVT